MTGKGGAKAPKSNTGAAKRASRQTEPSRATKTTRKAAGGGTEAGAAPGGMEVANLPVLEKEDPWTSEELTDVAAELEADRQRLHRELDEAEADLAQLMRDSGEGSGDDQADAGAATWEREHELSLTNNAKELLEQVKRALERIESGTYGICESCGEPIGKMRLQAFPRATLCLTCKQKQERR